MVPELVSSIRLVTDEIPPVIEEIRLWAIAHLEEMPEIQTYLENADIDWKNMMEKAVNILLTGAGGIFNSAVLVSIFAVYLLSSKEKLASQGDRIMRAYLPDRVRNTVCYAFKTLHEVFTSFIVGQCMEAVIIGTLCALGMTLLRFPYAVMTGAVVGVTALIPVVGAYIGAAVGAFMVFTHPGGGLYHLPGTAPAARRKPDLPKSGGLVHRPSGHVGPGGCDHWRRRAGRRRNAPGSTSGGSGVPLPGRRCPETAEILGNREV